MVHVAVHGHFYQPPREMPSNGCVPVEPSAAPAHDWNERIADECYRPNAAARIMDQRGHVLAIVNNFELLSFDLGPTLARWLARARPAVHDKIVAADHKAHTAIAQPFHHTILPLANERDQRTELLWGLADFRARFGREADAMWLPEAGVATKTMQIMASLGVQSTILMAEQASSQVDPSRPYRWQAANGRTISIAFADHAFSSDLAFGVMGGSAQGIVDRAETIGRGGLGLAATDGETFGHHHVCAERTIAFGLGVLARRRGHTTGSAINWLLAQEPGEIVGVRESAWSCAHGLGRWQTDCGCSTGARASSNQRWRGPLRAALDLIRNAAAQVFSITGAKLFSDPWAARDSYGDLLSGAISREEFCSKYLRAGADPVVAFELMESQRHALAMYTSCAWFFHDLAGLETVLGLRHAARCLDLVRHAAGVTLPLDPFFAVLATALSNDPAEGTGVDVWRTWVEPARDEPADNSPIPITPAGAMSIVVADAVGRAIASRHPDDIGRARDVVRTAGGGHVIEDAQEAVYDVLLAEGDHTGLDSLGHDLGLAVGRLGLDLLIGSSGPLH
jgi:Domain of unknown function (DUF3536)/Glycosyl hydrolase family 57